MLVSPPPGVAWPAVAANALEAKVAAIATATTPEITFFSLNFNSS